MNQENGEIPIGDLEFDKEMNKENLEEKLIDTDKENQSNHMPINTVLHPNSPAENLKLKSVNQKNESSPVKKSKPKKVTSSMKSYMVLILILNLFVCFGMRYTYDFPQALEDPLIRKLNIDTFKVEYLYSLYALPNLLMAPVSGYFIEKLNMPLSGMILAVLTAIGHGLCLHAVASNNFAWALVGRGVFGVGGEGLGILQATINEYWFSGVLLSVSNALCQFMNNLSDMTGNFMTPLIYESYRTITLPLFIGGCVCIFSCLITIGYYWAHIKFDRFHKEHLDSSDKDKDSKVLEGYFALIDQHAEVNLTFGFSSVRYFNLTFWLLCLVFLCLQNVVLQFTNMATEVIMYRYGFNYEDAKYFTILPQASFILFTPIIACLIMRRGKKAQALLLASVLCCGNYIVMYYLPANRPNLLYVNMAALGISNAVLQACIYSSIALTVPKSGISMAYSILALVDNLAVAFMPVYFGWLGRDRTYMAYNDCILSLIILSVLSVLSSILLLIQDIKQHGLLQLPENSKKVANLRRSIDVDYLKRSFHRASKKLSQNVSRDGTPKNSPKGSGRDLLLRQRTSPKDSTLSAEPYQTVLTLDIPNNGKTQS